MVSRGIYGIIKMGINTAPGKFGIILTHTKGLVGLDTASKPINVMESMVNIRVDELMKEEGICNCPTCRMDVITLSLNILPAKYTSSRSGDIYARFNAASTQVQADITAAILAAIATVKKNPRHPNMAP